MFYRPIYQQKLYFVIVNNKSFLFCDLTIHNHVLLFKDVNGSWTSYCCFFNHTGYAMFFVVMICQSNEVSTKCLKIILFYPTSKEINFLDTIYT